MADAVGSKFDVPPEQLRETMSSVNASIEQAQQLGAQAEQLVSEVVGSGQFSGAAANAAVQAMVQIADDLNKILQHGTFLAEHLGKTATIVEEGESNAVAKINAVFNSSVNV